MKFQVTTILTMCFFSAHNFYAHADQLRGCINNQRQILDESFNDLDKFENGSRPILFDHDEDPDQELDSLPMVGASFKKCPGNQQDLSSKGDPESLAGTYVYLRNYAYEDKRIAQYSLKDYAKKKDYFCDTGDCLGTYEKDFYDDQLWVLEQKGETEWYAIRNKVHTNSILAMDCPGCLGIWTGNKDDNTYWKFEKGEVKNGVQYYYILNKKWPKHKIQQYGRADGALSTESGRLGKENELWALVPQYYCGHASETAGFCVGNGNTLPWKSKLTFTYGVSSSNTKEFSTTTELAASLEFSAGASASAFNMGAKATSGLTHTIGLKVSSSTTESWSYKKEEERECEAGRYCCWNQARSTLSNGNGNTITVYNEQDKVTITSLPCDDPSLPKDACGPQPNAIPVE